MALQTLILVLGIVELLVELLNVLPELLDELVLVEALLRRRVLSLAAGCLLRLTGTRAGRRVRRELLPQLGVDLLQLGDLGVALLKGSSAGSAVSTGANRGGPGGGRRRAGAGRGQLKAGADVGLQALILVLGVLEVALQAVDVAAELLNELLLGEAPLVGLALLGAAGTSLRSAHL